METLKKVIAWLKKAIAWIVAKANVALGAILKVTTNPYTWVQWCHFSIGYSTFLFTYVFHGNLYVAAAFFCPGTIYKECWIDPHKEHGGAVGKPDWDDLAFYWAGMTFMLLLLHYTHHR